MVALGVVEAAAAVSLQQPVLVAAGFVVALLGIMMTSVLVTVDRRGLYLRWGPLGLIRTGVALAEISRAEAIDIQPLQWGGWGYRGSLRVLGRAAVVLRTGPGVHVDLRSGRVLAVTVDDAETAAKLLRDLIARHQGSCATATKAA